jgi:hypothetical protein
MPTLRGQVTNRKGRVTRKGKMLQEALDGNVGDRAALLHLLKELEDAGNELEDMMDDLIDETRRDETAAKDVPALQTEKDGVVTAQEAALTRFGLLITARTTPTTDPSAVPGGARQIFKLQAELKPFLLSNTHSPPEMRNWLVRFQSYASTSNIHLVGVADQRAVLRGCLAPDLEVNLEGVLATPASTVAVCLTAIEAHFLSLKPLFTRRWECFKIKKAGRPFKDFVADLRRNVAEADIANISSAQLVVFMLLMGCQSETALFIELRKMTDPTITDLMAKAETMEQALRDAAVTTAVVAAVKEEKVETQAEIIAALAAACGGCGRPHERSACPFRKAECFRCRKIGHIRERCSSTTRGETSDRRSQDVRGRSRDRGRSPPARQRGGSPAGGYNHEASRSPSRTRVRAICVATADGAHVALACVAQGAVFNLDVLPDTGAARTVLPTKMVPPGVPLVPSVTRLIAANGGQLRNVGKMEFMAVAPGGRPTTISAVVSPDLVGSALLGRQDMVALGILPKDFPAVQAVTQAELIAAIDRIEAGYNHEVEATAEAELVPPEASSSNSTTTEAIEKTIKRLAAGSRLAGMIRKEAARGVLGSSLGDAAGKMFGGPMKIELNKDVIKPCHVTTARAIPHHYQEQALKLNAELETAHMMVREPDPTEWCSPAHYVPKPNGKVRLVIDYRQLNKATSRPVHPFSSVPDLMRQIDPKARFFAKLDAIHGYFQVPLDEESSKLCTFLLPDGKYRPLVAPMGWKGSGDVFSLRTDQAYQDLIRKRWLAKIVDDLCLQAATLEELLDRLEVLFEISFTCGITLSLDKLEIGTCVKFAGFLVSDEGLKPDPAKMTSIKNFPTPTSVTGLRSFLGLANQFSPFVPDLSHCTVKIRELLKKKSAWLWLPEHDAEFRRACDILCSEHVVQPFNPVLPTRLLTDASRDGLGYALLQTDRTGRPRMVQCGSCSLTPAQKNYAVIELELAAVWWAADKCDYYLRGMPRFEVVTDHRPLVGLFGKPLSSLGNARLQRLRENLAMYTFEVSWVPGKTHLIADALSRAPVFPAEPDLDIVMCARVSAADPQYKIIADATDAAHQLLLEAVSAGKTLPPILSPFQEVFSELRVEDGLLLVGDRLVVPRQARRAILAALHASHSGYVKTMELARQTFFWPGMANEIRQFVARCPACVGVLASQTAEPLASMRATAEYPMQAVATDLFESASKSFLVMVDRFSGMPFVARMTSTTTDAVWKQLMTWFMDFGLPGTIRSDNGPQFRQSFGELCLAVGVAHETSSPYCPASNGLAEAAVKSMKRLLVKVGGVDNEVFRSALLEWRNTPRADGFSPAMGFFGRRLKTFLPSALPLCFDLEAPIAFSAARDAVDAARVSQKGGTTLRPLSEGEDVHVQDPVGKSWSFCAGVVKKCLPSGRSYDVQTTAGVFRRNRRHLRPADTATDMPSDPERVEVGNAAEMPEALLPAWLGAREAVTPLAPRRSRRNRRVSFA